MQLHPGNQPQPSASSAPIIEILRADWFKEAERRYGARLRTIRFRCPSCGFVQGVQDFLDLGMTLPEAASRCGFSCIGRWMPTGVRDAFTGGPGPCNYAGSGLIRISPIVVILEDGGNLYVFDFADEPLQPGNQSSQSAPSAIGEGNG